MAEQDEARTAIEQELAARNDEFEIVSVQAKGPGVYLYEAKVGGADTLRQGIWTTGDAS